MGVGPALPWRAASAETLRNRLLMPAWIGGLTIVACVLGGARGVADVDRLRARRVRARERRPFGRRRCARAPARDVGGDSGRGGAHGARRIRGSTAVCSSTSGVVVLAMALATTSGYTTKREVQLRPGQSTTVRGFTVTYLRHQDGGRRAEDDDRGRRAGAAGHDRPRNAPPGDLDVPELPRRHRHAGDPQRSVARRVSHAGLRAERGQRRRAGHDRGAGRDLRDVALDRRAAHGARHPARAHSDPSPARRSSPPLACSTTSNASWPRRRHERHARDEPPSDAVDRA